MMRYLLTLIFIVLFCFNYVPSANSTECLPTCSSVDGKLLAIAGTGLSTIVGAEIVINLVSTGDVLEFGIFDGEAGENWDAATSLATRFHMKYELHADPAGDSSGLTNPIIATWTGDGSGGLNVGNPRWAECGQSYD